MKLKRINKFTVIFLLVCAIPLRADDYSWFGWHLFKAPPPKGNTYAAAVALDYSIDVEPRGAYKFDVTIQLSVAQDRSFMVPAYVNKDVLRHELYHYKLFLAYFGLFESEAEFKTWPDAHSIVLAFDRWVSVVMGKSVQYDNETNHGVNAPKQREWERAIDTILEILGGF